ncbi:protein sgt1 [Holotrichia oblita]|uniref:Protein sgt1 n=1 Tax=Holotrichia oblita TaxID=644536 RepID=A0ACB9SLK5_HOLOL|nr:protein sgt1 [Holotrichia oblita]
MSDSTETVKRAFKHDWYQTEATVVVTVLIKNVQQDKLKINFNETNLGVNVQLDDGENYDLEYHLRHKIVPEQCSYKITPSKIEIKLKKLEGLRWDKLEGNPDEEVAKVISQASTVQITDGPPPYPTSKKGKDWSAIEKNIKEQESKEKPEGEDAVNKLFQEIYGKGSDEVKKAMNKSYLESGGTVLSTNWDEIKKDKVPVKPPDGMEWKKWD